MTISTKNAILTNLTVLAERLAFAASAAKDAQQAMKKGNQVVAIGTVIDLQKTLSEADALLRVALTLHVYKKD